MLIGKGLLEIAPIVSVITGSVKSIYGLLDSIKSKTIKKENNKDSDIYELVDKLDLRDKLNTYSLLISEFPGTKSQSIKHSLISLRNIIIDIEIQLKNIKGKIDYNKSLWIFTNIRSYSFSKDLKDLEVLIGKLDSRIDSLKTVMEISRLWNGNLFTLEERNFDNIIIEEPKRALSLEISSFEIVPK